MSDFDRPSTFAGRTILVGVCGGIAAYKCAGVVSKLRQAGADVHVIMTAAAQRFVTPLTFQALSGNDVHTEMFDAGTAWQVAHISLVRKSSLFLILNATANTLAKLAHGIADDLLSTCALATRNPVLVAAAMNTAMYEAEPTQRNIETLQSRGYEFVSPGSGFLACGEIGEGRLAEEDEITEAAGVVLARTASMSGDVVVVTAGPTREFADPARFLSNPSTGKMGYAIASEARARGARVTVISGPTHLRAPAGVDVVRVTTAREMHAAVLEHIGGATVFVGAAAVADFRPAVVAAGKVKKDAAELALELARNPDIIADVAEHRPRGCFVVGFAAETDGIEKAGREKLERKGLDCIVVNRIGGPMGGFAADDNEVVILWGDGGREAISRAPKSTIARAVLDRVAALRDRA
ncbi:MAG TPA: bifunctional phosphopantothenoylcysteine decarboxylase/phosphopantothenate--cysteine ligase CoaBC [Candidatus Eremiobacteraceae bacterium]|nr:bifunctional phosphopantothenoylcysteine decarboxylase/phosphopantothenate--cysteine ligase CoaBC [Candidatus Eremiobacteraceae bacterium]